MSEEKRKPEHHHSPVDISLSTDLPNADCEFAALRNIRPAGHALNRPPVCRFFHESRCIFTLIELLVVISIIAVLAGMLLPALNKARERARAISCLNRHKTVGTMITVYADTYDGHLPLCQYRGAEGIYSVIYLLNIHQYGWTFSQMENNAYDISGGKVINVKARMAGVWQCPSEEKFWYQANRGLFCYIGNYAFNSRLLGYASAAWPSNIISSIKQPSETGVMLDGLIGVNYSQPQLDNYNFFRTYPQSNYASIAYRHDRRTSILYLDGHVAQAKANGPYPPVVYTNGDKWWK